MRSSTTCNFTVEWVVFLLCRKGWNLRVLSGENMLQISGFRNLEFGIKLSWYWCKLVDSEHAWINTRMIFAREIRGFREPVETFGTSDWCQI